MRRAQFSSVLLIASVVGLVGCQKTSNYALSSPFANVYTSQAAYAKRPKTVFPNGLNRPALDPSRPYFIQFRARNAESYGHLSVAFGKLNANGQIPKKSNGDLAAGSIEISGLAPASDKDAVYSAGHVLPVYATTGPSDGDDEVAFALATYQINLSQEEFERTVAIIRDRRKRDKYWNAISNSCVTYARNIANAMGLKTPSRPHLPEGFVNSLKAINS